MDGDPDPEPDGDATPPAATWAALFERGAAVDVSVEDVVEALATVRGSRS